MVEGINEQTLMGIPTNMFFKVQKKRALLIVCNEYANLRELTGKPYEDLETTEDIFAVKHGLQSLKFLKEDIFTLINPNTTQFMSGFKDACR